MLPRQQHIDHAGEREQIVAAVGKLTFEHLATGIARGGYRNALRRCAEIQHPQFALIGDEYVLRIDVPVHDPVRVGIGECRAHIADDGECVGAGQGGGAGGEHVVQSVRGTVEPEIVGGLEDGAHAAFAEHAAKRVALAQDIADCDVPQGHG